MAQELRTSQGHAEVDHTTDKELDVSQGIAEVDYSTDARLTTSQGIAEVDHNIDVVLSTSQGLAEVDHNIDNVLYDSQGIAEVWWTPFVIGTGEECFMVGYFKITDGTTIINIVPNIDNAGYNLLDWTPNAPEELEVWNNSPYSDGRRLAIKKYGNTVSSFVMHISGDDPDQVIDQATDLRQLLQKGVEYWSTSWQTAPVWIEARGNCETNARYAYVLNFSAPHDDDPYIAPTGVSPSVFENFDLIIEHSHWMDALPGSCLENDNVEPNGLIIQGKSYPAASTDDVIVNPVTHAFSDATNALAYGQTAGGDVQDTAIRFTNVVIPQGALINNAYVRLEQNGAGGGGTDCIAVISGEDIDDAPTFVNYADWVARVRTTAVVNTTVTAKGAGAMYNLPNISTIIQEIVNRPGWVSGNDIVIFIDDNGSDIGALREPTSWDGAPTMPELVYEYSDTDLGRTRTCLQETFFANKHNAAQLTHIFQEDNVGAFGTNQFLDPLPIFMHNADVGYKVYFGVDSNMANGGGPFDNIIFDLASGTTGSTGHWEYWNGGWANLTFYIDDTNSLVTLGVNGIYFEQPADWVTTAVNGVTGYWIRYNTTACPGAAPAVLQQNRYPYSVITPYINIDAADVTGNISALARLKLFYESMLTNVAPTDKVMIALRSCVRGNSFSPFINLSEVQNRPGITVVSADGVDTSIATDMQSATGLAAFWNNTTTYYLLSTITIAESVASQYSGKYRAFIRCRQHDHAIGDISVKISGYVNSQTFFESPYVPTYTIDNVVSGINHIMLLDMGIVSIPFDTLGKLGEITITINGQANFASIDFYYYELILMPADEWVGEYSGVSDLGIQSLDQNQVLDIDPLSMPKIYNPSNSRHAVGASLDYQISKYKGKGVSAPILQAHADQRLWFLSQGNFPNVAPYTADCDVYLSHMEITHSFVGYKALRYYTSRGTR